MKRGIFKGILCREKIVYEKRRTKRTNDYKYIKYKIHDKKRQKQTAYGNGKGQKMRAFRAIRQSFNGTKPENIFKK